jgi:membrane associated rhomboid family serine protease
MRGMAPSTLSYSFGPGRLTPAVRVLIAANVLGYVLTLAVPSLTVYLGLIPALVVERFWLWQPVTYMFQHGGLFHLLFNMLALWMFGVELERLWGTRFFARFYMVSGIGAAAITVLLSLLPFGFSSEIYAAVTVGASGAIYGLLLAYGMTYPNRPIYMYLVFPIPAKIFVLLIGAISFFSSISESRGGVAHATHLGGLAVGYLYLTWTGSHVMSQIRSQWLRFRMARLRKRFDVHDGGRSNDHRGPWVH